MAAPWDSCIAWFPDVPNVEKLLSPHKDGDLLSAVEDITKYESNVDTTSEEASPCV